MLSIFFRAAGLSAVLIFTSAAHAALQIQYFEGQIQRTSADGKIPYGPAFSSLARRKVDLKAGKVLECVFQEGKAFVTTLTASGKPLVFKASDLSQSFTGDITFEDPTAMAWSYDLQVTKPTAGHLTGYLKDGNGARIDPKTGAMTTTKFWNQKVRIYEEYRSITEVQYRQALTSLSAANKSFAVPPDCND